MKQSIGLASLALALIASTAAVDTLTADLGNSGFRMPTAEDFEDGGYYIDSTSDVPFKGTVEDFGYDPRDDWELHEDEDTGTTDAIFASDGTLIKRAANWFSHYRELWKYRTCSRANNCVDHETDDIEVHNDCNGGRCKGERWMSRKPGENMCAKSFKSCGRTYQMTYTGKEWSCARLLHFNTEGRHHGKTYANLMRNGRKVGTCKYFTKKRFVEHCSIWATSTFHGQVQCQIY